MPSTSVSSNSGKCRLCDYIESSHHESKATNHVGHQSTSTSAGPCHLCVGEHECSEACHSALQGIGCQDISVCGEPECSTDVCEECSAQETCCQECSDDCFSDCRVAFDDKGEENAFFNDFSFVGSDSELFGDQAGEMFGPGSRLPQLPMDATPDELIDISPISGSISLPTTAGYMLPEMSFDFDKQPNPPLDHSRFHTAVAARITTTDAPTRSNFILPVDAGGSRHPRSVGVGAVPLIESPPISSIHTSPAKIHHDHAIEHNSPASLFLGNVTRTIPVNPLEQPDNELSIQYPNSQKSSIVREGIAPETANIPILSCQWVDRNGLPCGEAFPGGDELHNHLKMFHGVKTEVFCRWQGCRVGVFGPTPHKYGSVLRHTWGHSGYRPYKCPTCGEGFAAASVRDEHITNIHLKRKTFSCDKCNHHCSSATNLKRHKDEKHGTERFQCEFCNHHGKRTIFPRGPNLARHFRKCKSVLAAFPDAITPSGKIDDEWFPPGYRGGHHGMDRAKIKPPNYMPA